MIEFPIVSKNWLHLFEDSLISLNNCFIYLCTELTGSPLYWRRIIDVNRVKSVCFIFSLLYFKCNWFTKEVWLKLTLSEVSFIFPMITGLKRMNRYFDLAKTIRNCNNQLCKNPAETLQTVKKSLEHCFVVCDQYLLLRADPGPRLDTWKQFLKLGAAMFKQPWYDCIHCWTLLTWESMFWYWGYESLAGSILDVFSTVQFWPRFYANLKFAHGKNVP